MKIITDRPMALIPLVVTVNPYGTLPFRLAIRIHQKIA
jgi:hypothetical protein